MSDTGRPTKYKKEYENQVYKLCLLGATDKELADFFGVVESTINEWKIKQPEFSESMKRGKINADAEIAESLHKRAKGYRYIEKEYKEGLLSKEVEKEVAPDTTAAIIWLKNRQPKSWRDKQEVESHNTNINYDMSQLSAAQLERIVKMTNEKEIEEYYNRCVKGE